ncbi:MAG: TIM barrel protein [Candidatus Woesearchaeota archaeon]
MDKLRFGTAGIPLSTPERNTVNGIGYVRKLGLECMELEFVRSVNITKDRCPEIKKAARDNDIELSCHGQYYINLNSEEKKKIEESKERILKAARIANLCGAKSLTFHAGFYMKKEKDETYKIIKKNIKEVVGTLKSEGNKITIRPETTGKGSQWGEIQEIITLSEELEQVLPCIDFSHLYARSIGKLNSYQAFNEVLSLVEKRLGKEGLQNMHCHISGIEYGDKGERRHLILKESKFNYSELLKAMKEHNCKGVVICESPNIEEDALLLQKTYQNT